jgi:hypothetical protein
LSEKLVPYSKKFLCLANSRKLNGACVAGKLLDGTKVGGWIRPVADSATGELKDRDRRYRDGVDPKLFDIVEVQLLRLQVHPYQSENHVIDDKMYWVRAGRATGAQVKAAIDKVDGALWENQSSSTDGLHDRVLETRVAGGSLKLIEVEDLKIKVAIEGAAFNNPRKRVRADFTYNKQQYWLSVTDPIVEAKYRSGELGTFTIGRAVLCISLGEPYKGYAYKLVAGIMTL